MLRCLCLGCNVCGLPGPASGSAWYSDCPQLRSRVCAQAYTRPRISLRASVGGHQAIQGLCNWESQRIAGNRCNVRMGELHRALPGQKDNGAIESALQNPSGDLKSACKKRGRLLKIAARILIDRQAASLCVTPLDISHDERVVVGLANLANRLAESSPLSTATLTCTR